MMEWDESPERDRPERDYGDDIGERMDRNLEIDQRMKEMVTQTKYDDLEKAYHDYLIVLLFDSKTKYSTSQYQNFTKESIKKLIESDIVNRINELNKQLILSWKPPAD